MFPEVFWLGGRNVLCFEALASGLEWQGGNWGGCQKRSSFLHHQWAPSQLRLSPAALSRMNVAWGARGQMTAGKNYDYMVNWQSMCNRKKTVLIFHDQKVHTANNWSLETRHMLLTVSKLTSTLTPVVRFITATPGTPSAWSQTPPTTTRFSPITWAEWEYLRFKNDYSINSCIIKYIKYSIEETVIPWHQGWKDMQLLPAEAYGRGLQQDDVS